MWYDKTIDEWITNDSELWETLKEIAGGNKERFGLDDFIDELYGPIHLFGNVFYPSTIIKNLDEILYEDILDSLEDDWVDDISHRLLRVDPKEEDSIAFLLEEDDEELEEIVWRSQE